MSYSGLIFIAVIGFCKCAVIPNAFLPPEKQTSSNPGLYSGDDKVLILSASNLHQNVYEQNHATEVEFYNSFCGFCKRFAPIYKKYAADLYVWSDIVKIAAIDCAAEENNELCREFEIMAYPSLRYFPPFYKPGDKQLGLNVTHAPMEVGHDSLIAHLRNETKPPSTWPKLTPLPLVEKTAIFNEENESVQYMFLVNELHNQTTTAQDVALDFHKMNIISVRQVVSVDVANRLALPLNPGLFVIERNSDNVNKLDVASLDRTSVAEAIKAYVKTKKISSEDLSHVIVSVTPTTEALIPDIADEIQKLQSKALMEQVVRNPDTIYQADLEAAIKYSIFHELVQHNEFHEESLISMQRYIHVLKKYSPLGANGHGFLEDLNSYVININNNLSGRQLEQKINEIEIKWQPIFSSNRWVGCQGSAPGLRGFTCGLWVLFHFITVQAANAENTTDPLEALRAIHGYVKHFFGCSDCSQHFQTMATANRIWNVTSKDEAVLWLWNAHNEVNRRLAGDETEDPVFPKIQYPSERVCSACRQNNDSSSNKLPTWEQHVVLNFVKRVYASNNVNRLGVDAEGVLPEALDTLRHKRQIGDVISDIDIRMGILLYACCMGMIVVAVKLFLKRGYRKKLYMHDILGKV